MKKTKIAIFSFPMESRFGGPPIAVVNVCNELANNFKVNLIVVGKYDANLLEEISPDVSIHYQKALSINVNRIFFGFNSNIRKVIRTSNVLLNHGFYSMTFLNVLLHARDGHIKRIMPHGVFEIYQQNISKLRKVIFDYVARKSGFSTSWKFLVASESELFGVKNKFSEHCALVVGIPVKRTASKPASRVLSNGPIRILHLGRIAKKKRIDLTLRVIPRLLNSGLDVEFHIAGNGDAELTKDLEILAGQLEIERLVFFHGLLLGEPKFDLMRSCHIFALPSENENYAIAVKESLLLGIPCIVTKEVALSVEVEKYEAGIVLKDYSDEEYFDSFIKLVSDYSKFSKNAWAYESRQDSDSLSVWSKALS